MDVKNQLPEFDLLWPIHVQEPKVTCFSGSLGLASADPLHGPLVRGMEKLHGYRYFACCRPTRLNANLPWMLASPLPPIAPADCYGERSWESLAVFGWDIHWDQDRIRRWVSFDTASWRITVPSRVHGNIVDLAFKPFSIRTPSIHALHTAGQNTPFSSCGA